MSEPVASLKYHNTSNRPLAAYPVTYGIPLPDGRLTETTRLGLRFACGTHLPVQTRVLETWPDGSVKWLLLDFALPVAANEQGTVDLVEESVQDPSGDFDLRETPEAITVTSKALAVRVSKTEFSFFDSYRVEGREMIAAGSDIILEDLDGKRYYASLSQSLAVSVLTRGSQRIVVQVSGRHTAEDGAELLSFRVRYTFRPNEPGVDIACKFSNCEEPETGVKLASIQVVLPTALGRTTTKHLRQAYHGVHWHARLLEIRENVEVVSGLTLVDAGANHYGSATQGKVLIRNLNSLRENYAEYAHYLRPGNPRTDAAGGLRSVYPYLAVNGANGSLVGWFFDMELNFPKGLRCDRGQFAFDIWPAFAGPLQVRRGQSKEHEMYLSFGDATRTAEEMEGIYFDHEFLGMGIYGATERPVKLTMDADYIRDCRVLELHRWLRQDRVRYTAVETKLGNAGEAFSLPAKGMWDVGDYVSPDRSWCHNNENDAILDGIREYYRQENPARLSTALLKARHNVHVDFIAFDPDPLRQGTMPAHCPEHTDGAAYPSHMWVDGLMAAYCVSGETDFLDAALSVGENMLRWQQDNPVIFYADSRECGWPMLAYLRLHQYTKEERWLEACEDVYQFYRRRMDDDGMIRYELPHGVGTYIAGYGEFIGWRSLFFYYERTGRDDVKDFLVRCLDRVYRRDPGMMAGWACNDLFPAWAAYALTGDDRYIEDNYAFFRFLMQRPGDFPWGGMDVHYYLAELDRRGVLGRFCLNMEGQQGQV